MTHIPVLLAEVLKTLSPQPGEVILDGTFGGGGYSAAFLDAAPCTVWAMDRDPEAISRGASLAARHPGRLHLLEGCFGDMVAHLASQGVAALDGVVLDLGVSSFQIDTPGRGFSFRMDGPLDMRMGRDGPSAADLVNTLDERELADILWEFGEERHSRRVARAIIRVRAETPFTTTTALAEVIRRAVPRDPSGMDGATRSFQALRIRVNDELGEVTRGLEQAMRIIAPGGRIVVVSFHSLEDRLVKRAFQKASGRSPAASRHDPGALMAIAAPAPFELLTQRSIRPGAAEVSANPRARSAHLRALQRKTGTSP
jgi:16S rRNA (cytosine1402-N4)-methyltransferase